MERLSRRVFSYVKGRPEITARVVSPTGESRFMEFLLDSGADISMISQAKASLIGINYDELNVREETVETANYSCAYTKKIDLEIKIDERRIKIPVFISKQEVGCLLGRRGFFDAFDILFQERLHRVTLMTP